MAKKEREMVGRIRYDENWHGEGEHYVFEFKFEDEDDNCWSMESAFPLVSFKDGEMICGSGDFIHYTALTKIREWQKQGIIKRIYWK